LTIFVAHANGTSVSVTPGRFRTSAQCVPPDPRVEESVELRAPHIVSKLRLVVNRQEVFADEHESGTGAEDHQDRQQTIAQR